jgi:hypothetical protein
LQKHHYIPEFYLKRWAGADGRLCEYSRPYKDVKARMTYPGGTGYMRGLYTLEGATPDTADTFENDFLSIADGTAAVALQVMLNDNVIPPMREKMAWTRFILTLIHRTPEGVARNLELTRQYFEGDRAREILKEYDKLKGHDDPPTAEEYLQQNKDRISSISNLELMANVMQSKLISNRLLEMSWHLGKFTNLVNTILTSDRPLVMTNGLKADDSHVVMPLSPQHVLCIAASDKVAKELIALSGGGELAARINDRMARQARKFVYGVDDRQLRFVENRLGEKIACSPFE